MRKNYIIKDARKTLAQQINNLDTTERTAMENTPLSSTGLSAVIPKDNDGYCTVYKMDCADGLGLMTVYQVYFAFRYGFTIFAWFQYPENTRFE